MALFYGQHNFWIIWMASGSDKGQIMSKGVENELKLNRKVYEKKGMMLCPAVVLIWPKIDLKLTKKWLKTDKKMTIDLT